MSTETTWP